MNKEIETRVTAMLSKNECILNSRIDSANFPIIKNGKNFQLLLPLDCQIKIDENSLYLSINGEDPIKKQFNQEIFRFPLQLNFPYIKICRMTNNVYEIYFQQDQTIRMMAENNITRDIIAVTLKMFCGQKILDHKFLNTSSNEIVSEENFESPKKNQEILEKEIKISEFNRQEEQYIIKTPSNTTTSELKNDESIQKSNKPLENINKFSQESKNSTELLLLKIEDQAREINRLNQENDLFRKEKSHNSEESLTIIKEKEQLSTELFQIKHNYMEVLRENEQFKTKLEKLLTEKNFLLQDLTLYQTQLKSNEENTISLETKISILTKEYEEKNLDQTQNCEIQLKKNEISQVQELEKEIMGCKQEIKILNDQLIIKLSTIKELSQSNEDLENKINYLMKKTESMKYETSKSFQSNNNHIHDRNNNEELDIEKLQLQVVGFEKTIKE